MSSDREDQEHEAGAHVHFEAADQVKSNQVVIKQKRKDCLEIQLGFLQIHHMYEIQVEASSSILPNELRLYLINILKLQRILALLQSYNNQNILDLRYR